MMQNKSKREKKQGLCYGKKKDAKHKTSNHYISETTALVDFVQCVDQV